MVNKCINCDSYTDNKKYCSKKCMYEYFKNNNISAFYDTKLKKSITSKGGKKGSIVWREKRRRLGLKPFPMSCMTRKLHNSRAGKLGGVIGGPKGVKTQIQNKIGIFGFSKLKKSRVSSLAGKSTARKHPNHSREVMLRTHKKYPELSRNNALKAIKTMRKNIRAYKVENNFYDSKWEAEIAMCIKYQYNLVLIEDKTIHVRVGYLEYDFLIKKISTFVEYHPCTFGNGTLEEYYIKRRKNLDNNNYRKYNLVILK